MVPGVGRPEIGPAFSVRFPEDLLERIDADAASVGVSRASWLRAAAEERLSFPRAALAVLADWMVREGMAGEVGYALERLDKHGDLLFCAEHGISGAGYDELAEAPGVGAASRRRPPRWMGPDIDHPGRLHGHLPAWGGRGRHRG